MAEANYGLLNANMLLADTGPKINLPKTYNEMLGERQQLEGNQNKLTQQSNAFAKENALSSLLKASVNPETGQVDWNKYSQGAAQGGYAEETLAGQEQSRALRGEAASEAKAKYEHFKQYRRDASQLLTGVKDQAGYEEATAELVSLYPEYEDKIPPDFNPERIAQGRQQAMTFEEQLKQASEAEDRTFKQGEAVQKQQNFETGQDTTRRGQDISQLNQQQNYAQRDRAIEATRINKPLTEAQAKATTFYSQMTSASENIAALEAKGYKPEAITTQVEKSLSGGATNILASPEAQKATQAQNQWAESFLRLKTGAAATESEVKRNVETFFPQIGDSKEVVDQKKLARKQAESDVLKMTGSAGGGGMHPPNDHPAGWTPEFEDEYNKLYGGQ